MFSALNTWKKVLSLFGRKERRKAVILLAFTFLSALFESLSIAAVFPFAALLLDPESGSAPSWLQKLFQFPFLRNGQERILFFSLAMVLLFALKASFSFFVVRLQSRYVTQRQQELSSKLASSYLHKDYLYFLQHNSSEMIRNINDLLPLISRDLLLNGYYLLTEVMIISLILLFLVAANPLSTLFVLLLSLALIAVYYLSMKGRIDRNTLRRQKSSEAKYRILQESSRSIKEIKVNRVEDAFVRKFDLANREDCRARCFHYIVSRAPHFIVESFSVTAIFLIVIIKTLQGQSSKELLPLLSLYALSGIRLIPSVSRIMNYLAGMRFQTQNFALVEKDLKDACSAESSDPAEKQSLPWRLIQLRDICFHYPDSAEKIFSHADFSLHKGEKIGLVGKSGAGKTTLADLLLSLLQASEGKIWIELEDGSTLPLHHLKMAYVPQQIFLLDDSLKNNITFGKNYAGIEEDAIWEVLEKSQLKDFVLSLPRQLETPCGEGGVRLSGGQRQRLGLARALYAKADFLILDEATSALDRKTEDSVLDVLESFGRELSLLIISHRQESLRFCDRIYQVETGGLHEL